MSLFKDHNYNQNMTQEEDDLRTNHHLATHSQEDKVKAAYMYILYGSTKKVSNLTKIPERTLRFWKKEDWWSKALEKAREIQDEQLKADVRRAGLKAIEAVIERLRRGDEVLDKNGNKVRKKISAKDALAIADKMITLSRLMDGQVTEITSYDPTALAKRFAVITTTSKAEEDEEH